MRFVIYDDEDMEPITVVSLPWFGEKDIERMGRRLALPVPKSLDEIWRLDPGDSLKPQPNVYIWFEPFVRSHRRGRQERWMAFTKAADLAMLLDPAWLPGQRSAVALLQQDNDRLHNFIDRLFATIRSG